MEKRTICWPTSFKRAGVLVVFLSLFLTSTCKGESVDSKEAEKATKDPVQRGGDMQEKKEETKAAGNERVRIQMEKGGEILIELYPEDAPNTVDNFLKLVKDGFYDGLTFHRVIPDFVAQGGDPKGDGTGDPGYKIKAEFNKRKHLNGTLSMARSQDPDSAGCQFYICLGPQPHLDGSYTVFGQVVEGMETVMAIQKGDKMKKLTVE